MEDKSEGAWDPGGCAGTKYNLLVKYVAECKGLCCQLKRPPLSPTEN